MKVTANFYGSGDNAGWDAAPVGARENLRKLATLLEQIRTAGGGVPMQVTSGYRTWAHNLAVGGSKTSQHLTGAAVDFKLVGTRDVEGWSRRVLANLPRSSFGQWIIYPRSTGHIHVSLPGSKSGQILMETGVGRYVTWNPASGSGGSTSAPDEREGFASFTLIAWLAVVAMLAIMLAGRR